MSTYLYCVTRDVITKCVYICFTHRNIISCIFTSDLFTSDTKQFDSLLVAADSNSPPIFTILKR